MLGCFRKKGPKVAENPVQNTSKNTQYKQVKIHFKPFEKKSEFICRFCGGKGCKHENYLTNPKSAIKGLNCDWITPKILATQRPSSRIIREFGIIESFKEKGIAAIFNLQEPGEHAGCGDGIHATSGFSYYPEEFYERLTLRILFWLYLDGIFFFNFGWRDMTATSIDVVLRVLKQIYFVMKDGNKIAVHCHAGRGRTGLIICAWLIYNDHWTAKEAIKQFSARRSGALSKKSQKKLLYTFEKELNQLRMLFPPSPKFTLTDYMQRQRQIYPLDGKSAEKFVPQLVLRTIEKFEMLISSQKSTAEEVIKISRKLFSEWDIDIKHNLLISDFNYGILMAFCELNQRELYKRDWDESMEKQLKQFKEQLNKGVFEMSSYDDPRILVQCVLDFFEQFTDSAISNRFIEAINTNLHHENKLSKNVQEKFFSQLDKKEFLLLETFVRLFELLNSCDPESGNLIEPAVVRLSISLLGCRKSEDSLFSGREMISMKTENVKVFSLKIFLLKWIENFHSNFMHNFLVTNSPLKISELIVERKLQKKHPSYMSQVLRQPTGTDSREGTPMNSPTKFGNKKSTFGKNQSQEEQDAKSINESSHNGTTKLDGQDTLDNLVNKDQGELAESALQLPSAFNTNSPSQDTNGYLPSPTRTKRSITSPHVLSNYQQREMLTVGHKKSLINEENNSQELDPGVRQRNISIQKNYDKFFQSNHVIKEETPKNTQNSQAHDEEEEDEQNSSDSSQTHPDALNDFNAETTTAEAFSVETIMKNIGHLPPDQQADLYQQLGKILTKENVVKDNL